ncbi:TetR/AcrR family transcriptional regulator [Nocardia otitidiscaviarum]|uniref:TetR/AcrR family transcriptional regulator n=1 Tax=Nocardia otitidiscaviarum TaxID=1823 RepID=UPI001FCFB978|nr:TetR/AcrR family transcriptional regulator [Nocardia otitidiscaviarum]MCP9625060.1 TetR/AcrR family transcriptional regulator [Nocardia otitidiscaviarum]
MPTERSTPTGRFQPPDVRRRQILDATAELLLADGYDALTMSKAAARAGVAKGTIYLYFASKQELLAALQSRMWERMLAEPAARLEQSGLSWTARLDGLVADWLAVERDDHELYHLLFHELGAAGGEEPMYAARELLVTLLRDGTAAGEFDVADPELTADFLTHAYVGPCHHHPDVDVTAAVQTLFRRVVGAVDRH